jgi:hypothetical protein
MPTRLALAGVLASLVLLPPMAARAQMDCGIVDAIAHPVDPQRYTLVQGFGAPSERHQGRYHTGEDWFAGPEQPAGAVVRAIARGRVTLASPVAWGRDAGVIIIEHRMPDGSVLYSQYGHIVEGREALFPLVNGCVAAGQALGVIADVRPAPHLHFELRTAQPDVPGPGYTWEDPAAAGWQQPARLIGQWQARLHPAARWALETGDEAHLVVLNEGSSLVLTPTGLRGITPDGRVLWRSNPGGALALLPHRGQTYVVTREGMLRAVNVADGSLGETIALAGPVTGTAEQWQGLWVFPTAGGYAAYNPDTRQEVWALASAGDFVRHLWLGPPAAPQLAGITADLRLLLLGADGEVVDQANLLALPGLGAGADGELVVYSRGGLWQVSADGTWSLLIPDAPTGGEARALLAEDDRLTLFNGSAVTRYTAGVRTWTAPVFNTDAPAELRRVDGWLALSAADGQFALLSDAGQVCARLDGFGDGVQTAWLDPGPDGLLRLWQGGQLLALDWQALIAGCG